MSYITEVGVDQEWDKVFFNFFFIPLHNFGART